jgi:hypothetical protein
MALEAVGAVRTAVAEKTTLQFQEITTGIQL